MPKAGLGSARVRPGLRTRPNRSAITEPSNAPSGAPSPMMPENQSEEPIDRPCLTRNVGTQDRKPYRLTPLVQAMTAPSRIVLPTRPGAEQVPIRAGIRHRRRLPPRRSPAPACPAFAASASIVCSNASASAVRPRASSQRGDSGMFLRNTQTISAPHADDGEHRAASRSAGMSQAPPSPVTGTAHVGQHREQGHVAPTLALWAGTRRGSRSRRRSRHPRPMPMTKRMPISTCMLGANAAASEDERRTKAG